MEVLAETAQATHGRVSGQSSQPALFVVPEADKRPDVRAVRALDYELETQARFNQWLGSLASAGEVEQIDVNAAERQKAGTNLLEQIRVAKTAESDSPPAIEAKKMIMANISTAAAEVGFKKGHISTAFMERDESGDLIQHGHTNDSIQRNAMTQRPNRHPALKNITKIEALNAHRIQDSLEAGELTDNYFVVASLVPTDVPEADLGPKGDGYFLREMTFVVQATTEQSPGRLMTKSAFMSGVEAEDDDSFEYRMAKRFDITVLQKVYTRLRQEPPQTVEEFLDGGLLIPKSLMPNGVADFMLWCAEAKDEIDGVEVERTAGEFMALELESKRREASLNEVNQRVYQDLVANEGKMTRPMDAVRAMWESIRTHMTRDSLKNDYLDPKVFGPAATAIVEARQHFKNGDLDLANQYMRLAHEQSEITGCGGGSGAQAEENMSEREKLIHEAIAASPTDDFGHLVFACKNGHLNSRPRNQLIDKCKTCGTRVKC